MAASASPPTSARSSSPSRSRRIGRRPNFPPSWNVAPTDPLPVVRYDAKAGERSLDVLRWGLVPYWAKDIKVGFANINAKAEGIEEQAGFPRGVPAAALPGAGRQLLRMGAT